MMPRPPNAWEAMLRGLHGVVGFFSRISFLVDENTHAVHFFISALLQLLDRCAAATRLPRPSAVSLCCVNSSMESGRSATLSVCPGMTCRWEDQAVSSVMWSGVRMGSS